MRVRSSVKAIIGLPDRDADYHKVEAIARSSQPDLFRLADMVTADAEQRAWDGVLIDEVGGHYPGVFIHTILAEQATRRGQQAPARLSLASSSRHLAHMQHRNVLMTHLAKTANNWSRALFVTELAERGSAASSVATDLRAGTGATTDFAVMVGYAPDDYKSRLGPLFYPDSKLYVARDGGEDEPINSNLLREASGFKTEYLLAEPLPLPNVDHRLVTVARNAFGALAQQYIDTRL